MGSFFHGWRRKAGCVLLVMACVCMIGWLRSTFIMETFGYANFEAALPIWFISTDGKLILIAEIPINWWAFRPSLSMWYTADVMPSHQLLSQHIEWCFRCCGFGYGTKFKYIQIVIFPYCAIAIPLTLLSAYLILWPGKRKGN